MHLTKCVGSILFALATVCGSQAMAQSNMKNADFTPLVVISGNCTNEAIQFEMTSVLQDPDSLHWSFGDQKPVIEGADYRPLTHHTYDRPGQYDVVLDVYWGENHIQLNEEINITQVESSLEDEYLWCPEEDLILDAGNEGAEYQWQDGSFDRMHEVSGPGTYAVKVNKNGCELYQVINVVQDHALRCQPNIWIPNSFTPNGDDLNERFTISSNTIHEFEMTIFDRWGNQLFYTADINKGWSGKDDKGQPLMSGVYVYRISYKVDEVSETQVKMGHVSLFR